MKNLSKKFAILISFLFFTFSLGCGHSTSGNTVYYAIGASDATGVGATPLSNGYVFRIDNALDECGADGDLNNLGIPGVETDEMQKVELPILLEGEPDLVTIFAGGNDIVNGVSDIDFQNDLSEILSKIKNETSAYIVIATIPDLTKLPRFISEPDPDVTLDRIALFNQIIRALATDNGAVVVELSEVSLSDVLVSQDGFHPSDEGHATIAEKFLEVIKPMFC